MSLLTDMERYIVDLILAGHTTNKELARETTCAPQTIQTHVGNIYKKLRVKNRPELVLLILNSQAGQPSD